MKNLRLIHRILKETGVIKILITFIIYIFILGLIVWLVEPGIHTYGDALWYCYAAATTIGFGDVVAQTLLVRILSVFLSFYAAIVIAIITGVVVRYFQQIVEMRNKETLAAFMDELERLPELSEDRLAELAGKVKRFRNH